MASKAAVAARTSASVASGRSMQYRAIHFS